MRDAISTERVNALHPAVVTLFTTAINEAEDKIGPEYAFRVVQGGRSIEYQNELFNQPTDGKDNDGDGRIDEPDEHVTAARGGQSFHNYFLAVDCCLLFKNEAGIYEYRKVESWIIGPQFMELVKAMKARLVEWGGDWTPRKRDRPHFQKTFGFKWQELLRRYNAKEFIPGTKFVSLK